MSSVTLDTISLTDRQRELLRIVLHHMRDHGRAPTIREVNDAMGIISPNGVVAHVKLLEKKGILRTKEGRQHRSTFEVVGVRLVPMCDGSVSGVLASKILKE